MGTRNLFQVRSVLALLLFSFAVLTSYADDRDDYPYHRMMGGGYGPGMMGGGGGPGYGMGMMGGGYGMGMMGGGYGMGMMGGPMHMLNLSDAQRSKINSIQDSSRKQNWAVMGKMMDERAKLRDLYSEERPNSSKILAVYDRIFALQKTMIQNSLSARNQQYDLLTAEQRKELKEFRGQMGWGYQRWHK